MATETIRAEGAASTQTVSDQIAAQRERAEAAYRELVFKTADQKLPVSDSTVQTVIRSGRSMEQFQTDVETRQRRSKAFLDLEAAKRMDAEISKANEAADRELDALEKMRQDFEKRLSDAEWRAKEAADRANMMRRKQSDMERGANETLLVTAPTAEDLGIAERTTKADELRGSLADLNFNIRQREQFAKDANHQREMTNRDIEQFNRSWGNARNEHREPVEMIDLSKDKHHQLQLTKRDQVEREIQRLSELNSASGESRRLDANLQRWTVPIK